MLMHTLHISEYILVLGAEHQKAASRSGRIQMGDELLAIDGTSISDKIPSLVRLTTIAIFSQSAKKYLLTH
jgi:hypothetical protein